MNFGDNSLGTSLLLMPFSRDQVMHGIDDGSDNDEMSEVRILGPSRRVVVVVLRVNKNGSLTYDKTSSRC